MTFIKTINPEDADGKLQEIYARLAGPGGKVDNILLAHALRPATLEGHMALYKAVLHHRDNNLPKYYLEIIGVYVSLLNKCAYCVDHHFAGLKRLINDDGRADGIFAALKAAATGERDGLSILTAREAAGLAYAEKLTRTPANMSEGDAEALRKAGFDDGDILEINQIAAYFAYANRTVLGLGVSVQGETLGLSPDNSDDENDWGHR